MNPGSGSAHALPTNPLASAATDSGAAAIVEFPALGRLIPASGAALALSGNPPVSAAIDAGAGKIVTILYTAYTNSQTMTSLFLHWWRNHSLMLG
jgi:hypothetical protein